MKFRVLIAGGSDTMREFLARVFESDPHLEVVAAASSGAAATERAREDEPHILVSDVEVEEMTGLDLVASNRRTRPRPPIVEVVAPTERGATAASVDRTGPSATVRRIRDTVMRVYESD